MTTDSTEENEFPIDTENSFAVHTGQNLPNHSISMEGYPNFVKVGVDRVIFRTKQECYRMCAYVLTLADTLPDEDGDHTFEEVLEAIQNT